MSISNGSHPYLSTNGRQPASLPNLLPGVVTDSPVPTPPAEVALPERPSQSQTFDQPIILQRSPIWSRAILWGMLAVTTSALIWANVAQIEEAIPATGKLEPQGTVKEVQAPVAGVIRAIYVDDGQRVQPGERLISFEPKVAIAQLVSLQQIRSLLLQENRYYQAQMSSLPATTALVPAPVPLKLPDEFVTLTKNRATLVAENQLYRAELSSKAPGVDLTLSQQERLQSQQAELNARVAAAQSEVTQLSKQLRQAQIKLTSTRDTLATNQQILHNIASLLESGAISQLQYLKQQEDVRNAQSEVDQLVQEQARLELAINEANDKVHSTQALTQKDLLNQIADNDKRIAEIDSQLTKAIVDNNQHIAEIDSQLTQAQMNLQYQELRAPTGGTVFELQAHTPGFVATSSQSLLKIVPDDTLTAKVFITNRDIGFVKEGMQVDVRIDSFPFSEFGDIKGKLVWIGSDALPPDQTHPYYRFPAKIRLEHQSLQINGRTVPLQSGMSVSANIKVRHRTVMSIFTEQFTQKIESLKSVR